MLFYSVVTVLVGGIDSVYATEAGPWPSFFLSQMPEGWFIGQNLKQGDFFSYNLCHADYKDCAEFQMDIWINGTIQVGTEDRWLAEVVVYDGDVIKQGDIHLGTFAADPVWSDDTLKPYVGAFKMAVTAFGQYADNVRGDLENDQHDTDTSEKCIKFWWCDDE